jgi:type I restriction enzyme M protein
LLKAGGVAGIILPSSILSNEGIYTKTREIILLYFEIIAIAELGSSTFMATGTNTVVLFLRRRNNYASINLRESVKHFFVDFQDLTHSGVEMPVAEYVNHVWEGLAFDDYISLLKKEPNDAVQKHELYREYAKAYPRKSVYYDEDTPLPLLEKMKNRYEEAVKNYWKHLLGLEEEKIYYFILAFPQQNVVVVKTGKKDAEKRFLGYEFSNRRGSEGIHPVQRGKTIEECTRLFDGTVFDNPEKASTYIYKAFTGDYKYPVHESLKGNVFRVRLVDMLTFSRRIFEKNISTAVEKKRELKADGIMFTWEKSPK